MSPLVAGDSTTVKDRSLMSFVPHRVQDLKPLEDCKCCISQRLQFEAETKVIGKQGFWYPSWGNGTKKSRLSRKKSQFTESIKNTKRYK